MHGHKHGEMNSDVGDKGEDDGCIETVKKGKGNLRSTEANRNCTFSFLLQLKPNSFLRL